MNMFSIILNIARFIWKRNSLYGPVVPHEIQLLIIKEYLDQLGKDLFAKCDAFFKLISWCLLAGVLNIIWYNTQFGLFLILEIVMLILLAFYIVTKIASININFFVSKFFLAKQGSKRKIMYFVFSIISLFLVGFLVPRLFLNGMIKLHYAQACASYHKDSPKIPHSCLKFVRF